MKIGVLGTGVVGQTISGKLVGLGNDVVLGTRDAAQTKARNEPGPFDMPSFSEWLKQTPGVRWSHLLTLLGMVKF